MTSAPASPFPVARQAPQGWAYLDYPKADILLQVTTRWEKSMRANACGKEPWTVAWIESMPAGGCLWNVGANVGSYALLAARLGRTVVAVEPSFASYAALCNNVLANRLERLVTPICAAVCEGAGIAPLAYRSTEAGAASHTFGSNEAPKTVGTLPTLAMSLDDLARGAVPLPTHILIDVDGAEPSVLAGGPQVLAQCAPSILIEVQPNLAESISSILAAAGYAERQRWSERSGQPMGIWYSLYERR